MRTIFVNPSKRRRKASKHRVGRTFRFLASIRPRRSKKRGGKRKGKRGPNPGITSFVRNPLIMNPRRRRRNPGFSLSGLTNMPKLLKNTVPIVLGSVGGAGLNRVGLSHITNFYMRNGARVVAAALLASFGKNSPMSIAAAGATLAPILPEVEMQLASTMKNPQELAAELAGLLEDGGLEADLADELSEEITW